MGADPAHCDKTDFHFAAHPSRRETTPPSTPITGTGNRCRNDLRHAVRKQHNGIVTKPRIKPTDATCTLSRGSSTVLTLKANIIFRKPSPQNEMWPSRVIRLRKEEYPSIH